MATQTTIQNTINWCTAFLRQQPTTGVGQIPGEPTITIVNILMGIILGAPFKWEWNRVYAKKAIIVAQGNSDYQITLPTFGYLEKAILVNPTAAKPDPPNWELELYRVLGNDGQQSRPMKIATLLDDNAGNITFRLFPVPNQTYTVDLIYQQAPIFVPQNADLVNTSWAPIPDKMAYLYQQGYRAQMQGMYNAQLYLAGMEMFYRQLVASSEGLTEMEKAIYLEDQLRALKTKAADLLTVQQAKGARS